MANEPSPPDSDNAVEQSFVSILLGDVGSAMRRYDASQSQQHRRELIRSAFAAIEGYAWLYRKHVVEAAKLLNELPLDEEIALSELNYQVSETGKIVTQPRFMSTLALVRLTTRIATRMSPELEFPFDTRDWQLLRGASAIRNRIAHPKSKDDLELSAQDASACIDAFFWLLELTTKAMEATNTALTTFYDDFRAVFEDLKRGNPQVWAMYEAVKKTPD